EVAEDFNLYLTEREPWKLAKTDPERARAICSAGVYASQVVAAILQPAIPAWGEKVQRFLRMPGPLTFASAAEPLPAGHALGECETLAEPIDPKQVAAIIEASKETIGGEAAAPAAAYAVPELTASASIDKLAPVDLRVGKVLQCENVE